MFPDRELLPYGGSAKLHEWVLGDLDATRLFKELYKIIPWESRTIQVFGKQHLQPRQVAWYGDPGRGYKYSGVIMNVRPWIPPLDLLKRICEEKSGASFNSLLLNLYRDGKDKVSWHSDNEKELGKEPCIASLSLGAVRKFRFRHRYTKEIASCSLPAGSLVVMSGLCQINWEHEIPKQEGVTDPRINLTFRNVRAS